MTRSGQRKIPPVDEDAPEPTQAVRQAALAAGWSHRHRDVSGGRLRPTVFGAVDGLVTNASLIAGLAGGGAPPHIVILTGAAALVAGAFSMGTGEYISVTNQNELVQAEVATERRMHARFPDAEEAELADTFRGYGADPDTASRMARAVSRDPDTALRLHTREELGVDPFARPAGTSQACVSPVAGIARAPSRPGRKLISQVNEISRRHVIPNGRSTRWEENLANETTMGLHGPGYCRAARGRVRELVQFPGLDRHQQ